MLNQDLYTLVISKLALDTILGAGFRHVASRRDLQRAALVCRAWNGVVNSLLYANVELYTTRQVVFFARTLRPPSGKGELVRRLRIVGSKEETMPIYFDDAIRDIVRKCTSISELSFESFRNPSSINIDASAMLSLCHLRLNKISRLSPTLVTCASGSQLRLPNLESLTISEITYRISGSTWPEMRILTHIEMQSIHIDPESFAALLTQTFSTLETLHLRTVLLNKADVVTAWPILPCLRHLTLVDTFTIENSVGGVTPLSLTLVACTPASLESLEVTVTPDFEVSWPHYEGLRILKVSLTDGSTRTIPPSIARLVAQSASTLKYLEIPPSCEDGAYSAFIPVSSASGAVSERHG